MMLNPLSLGQFPRTDPKHWLQEQTQANHAKSERTCHRTTKAALQAFPLRGASPRIQTVQKVNITKITYKLDSKDKMGSS